MKLEGMHPVDLVGNYVEAYEGLQGMIDEDTLVGNVLAVLSAINAGFRKTLDDLAERKLVIRERTADGAESAEAVK